MSLSPLPTELDTVAIHPLATSQTQLYSVTATTSTAVISEEKLASGQPSTSSTLRNNRSSLESHRAATAVVHSIHDDAITRHQIYPIGPEQQQQQPSPLQQRPPPPYQQQQQQQQQGDQLFDGQPSSPPALTRATRSRTRTSSRVSVDYSIPSFRLTKTDVSLCVNQSEAVCEIHDHHGPTAIAEEEAALEHSAALIAAKQALLSQRRASDIEAAAGAEMRRGSGAGVDTGLKACCLRRSSSCLCLPPLLPHHRHNVMEANSNITDTSGQGGSHSEEQGDDGGKEDEDEEDDRHEDVDEEECDHFCSGICLPRSQFFQTSVICSNTMTRDALANERTFLAWLNVSIALCLVSFTFISKSLSLDSVNEEGKNTTQKDHLSKAVGYICFVVALFCAVYSLLKYLRNIRRISTRYPFAQAGAWTFTVGMILGTLIMIVLVFAYTTMPV